MYILKIKEPSIIVKDLAATLNVSLDTARGTRVKIAALRKNAFELSVLQRLQPLLEENFYFIFSEKSETECAILKLVLKFKSTTLPSNLQDLFYKNYNELFHF